jgi:hypothetical protein
VAAGHIHQRGENPVKMRTDFQLLEMIPAQRRLRL